MPYQIGGKRTNGKGEAFAGLGRGISGMADALGSAKPKHKVPKAQQKKAAGAAGQVGSAAAQAFFGSVFGGRR